MAGRGESFGKRRMLVRRALLAVQEHDADPRIGGVRDNSVRGDEQRSQQQRCGKPIHDVATLAGGSSSPACPLRSA